MNKIHDELMLSRRTLPLSALRSFECAGRHLHFQTAGEELGVTQSAISHQIRSLEERLNMRLFDRSGNRLSLTPAGKLLLETTSGALDQLIDGVERLSPDTIAGKLTLGCTTTLLVSLVMKTIARFRESYPEIDLEVIEIKPLQKEIPRDIELAFCFGEPTSKDRQIEPLIREDIFPVCSPGLLQSVSRITRPAQLIQLPLLHNNLGHWDRWLAAMGLSSANAKNHLRFFNTHVALAAARRGLGVALATRLEVQNDLQMGTLVKVLDKSITEPEQYYLVRHFPENQTNRAQLFERWLKDDLASLV
jgi:LysR family glycine cleavage system transcriptional activator